MKKIISLTIILLSISTQGANAQRHYDSRYQYEYRTGTMNHYTYNYDVEDRYDTDITGNCDMSGKYGECVIIDENGDEVYADAQWISDGIMEVIDENGEIYEMEAQ